MLTRKNWKKVGVMVVLLTLFLIVGSTQGVFAADKGPIKLGYLAPLSGSRAQVGADMVAGFKMRLAENNYMVAGRKIELIVEDRRVPVERRARHQPSRPHRPLRPGESAVGHAVARSTCTAKSASSGVLRVL